MRTYKERPNCRLIIEESLKYLKGWEEKHDKLLDITSSYKYSRGLRCQAEKMRNELLDSVESEGL